MRPTQIKNRLATLHAAIGSAPLKVQSVSLPGVYAVTRTDRPETRHPLFRGDFYGALRFISGFVAGRDA